MSRLLPVLLVLVLWPVSYLWSQSAEPEPRQAPTAPVSAPLLGPAANSEDQATPGAAELPYSEPLTPPAIASGVRPPLTVGSEGERSNFISGTFQVTAAFDDNVLASTSDQLSDFSYLFAPGIMFNQTRERWNWTFAYYPGFTINQHLSERNQSAHNLSLDLTYKLTPHVALQLRDSFEKTSDLFSGAFNNSYASESGQLQGPNRSLITPVALRTGNTSDASLSYQFSRSSMVGGGATYYFFNYDDVAGANGTPSTLIDTRSFTADGYYAHRFDNRQWLGMAYNFQRLMFDFGGRTIIHRVLMFYSIPVASHLTLSLWAGPEYSTINPVSTITTTTSPVSQWSPAGGAAFDWMGQRTGFRAGYVRRINDGGGLSGAVTMQQANASVRRQLSARWTGSLGVSYSTNDPLNDVLILTSNIQVLSANAGVGYRLTENLNLGLQYSRDRQQYLDSIPPIGAANRNRVLVSLSYAFTRPLGR
jgi:hypothetical protein